jgi:hypothetical protein
MSIDDFTAKYYGFKVKPEDAEETFMMALKNALIKPIVEFRGRIFNRAEIDRFNFKKEQKMNGNSTELTKKIEENIRAIDNLKNGYFKYIREKYDKTIKEYAFLLDGIFKIVFPLLLYTNSSVNLFSSFIVSQSTAVRYSSNISFSLGLK